MNATLRLDQALRFVGTNEHGHQTVFDTSHKGGGLDTASSPMEVVLNAMAACSSMDILGILRKQRKTITDFTINSEAARADDHPKMFTHVTMHFRLESPDTTMKDLVRAIDLSLNKYCSVTIMIIRSGCTVTWDATIIDPVTKAEQHVAADELELVA